MADVTNAFALMTSARKRTSADSSAAESGVFPALRVSLLLSAVAERGRRHLTFAAVTAVAYLFARMPPTIERFPADLLARHSDERIRTADTIFHLPTEAISHGRECCAWRAWSWMAAKGAWMWTRRSLSHSSAALSARMSNQKRRISNQLRISRFPTETGRPLFRRWNIALALAARTSKRRDGRRCRRSRPLSHTMKVENAKTAVAEPNRVIAHNQGQTYNARVGALLEAVRDDRSEFWEIRKPAEGGFICRRARFPVLSGRFARNLRMRRRRGRRRRRRRWWWRRRCGTRGRKDACFRAARRRKHGDVVSLLLLFCSPLSSR